MGSRCQVLGAWKLPSWIVLHLCTQLRQAASRSASLFSKRLAASADGQNWLCRGTSLGLSENYGEQNLISIIDHHFPNYK
jgi:hypothetical protein